MATRDDLLNQSASILGKQDQIKRKALEVKNLEDKIMLMRQDMQNLANEMLLHFPEGYNEYMLKEKIVITLPEGGTEHLGVGKYIYTQGTLLKAKDTHDPGIKLGVLPPVQIATIALNLDILIF